MRACEHDTTEADINTEYGPPPLPERQFTKIGKKIIVALAADLACFHLLAPLVEAREMHGVRALAHSAEREFIAEANAARHV